MTTKLVTFKMDQTVKAEFDQFCSDVGLSVSNAFNMFARTVVRERRIPFEISSDPFYGEANMQALTNSASEADRGEFVARATVDDFEALITSL